MNPILLEFPDELYTERLHIRMPKPGDGKAVYNAVTASIDELKPWLPFAQKEQTEKDAEISVREAHINFLKRDDLRLLLFKRGTEELVGSSGLHRIDWDVRKFEIGYWVDTRYSGKGYVTEAVDGISRFAFNELDARRVEIRCDPLNYKSLTIPEKLGFTLEGILKNDVTALDNKNQVRDTCIYAKVNK